MYKVNSVGAAQVSAFMNTKQEAAACSDFFLFLFFLQLGLRHSGIVNHPLIY